MPVVDDLLLVAMIPEESITQFGRHIWQSSICGRVFDIIAGDPDGFIDALPEHGEECLHFFSGSSTLWGMSISVHSLAMNPTIMWYIPMLLCDSMMNWATSHL